MIKLRIQSVEDRQVPRWVITLLKARDEAREEFDDKRKDQRDIVERAKEFHENRKKAIREAEYKRETARFKLKNLTKAEIAIMLERDPKSRVKGIFNTLLIVGLMGAFLGVICFAVAAVCVQLKLGQPIVAAWPQFLASPVGYFHHMMQTFRS